MNEKDAADRLSVHVSTVGKSPEPIVNGFRSHAVDHQVLLHSVETAEVAKKVRQQIEDMAGQRICELIEVNPFDMVGIVSTILGIRNKFAESNLFVNITGGTNIMASSALVACFMVGGSAYYVRENIGGKPQSLKNAVIEIPIPKVTIGDLSEKQKKIIAYIHSRKGHVETVGALRNAIDDSPQLISYFLKELNKKGLVEFAVNGRQKSVFLTRAGTFFAQLV